MTTHIIFERMADNQEAEQTTLENWHYVRDGPSFPTLDEKQKLLELVCDIIESLNRGSHLQENPEYYDILSPYLDKLSDRCVSGYVHTYEATHSEYLLSTDEIEELIEQQPCELLIDWCNDRLVFDEHFQWNKCRIHNMYSSCDSYEYSDEAKARIVASQI